MGNKISISLKPQHESGPLMSLDDEGRWYSKPRNAFYRIDSNGARWIAKVKKRGKHITLSEYEPDNVLAYLIKMHEDGELLEGQLHEARFRANKGIFLYLQTHEGEEESTQTKIERIVESLARK
jgi:hypothetical protein